MSNISILTTSRILTKADADGISVNTSASNFTISLVAGLGTYTVLQTSTGTISVVPGPNTTVTGILVTSNAKQQLKLTESPEGSGVYRSVVISASPISIDPTTSLPDEVSRAAIMATTGGGHFDYIGIGVVGDSRENSITIDALGVTQAANNWLDRAMGLANSVGQILYRGGVSNQRTDQYSARVTTVAAMPSVTDVFLKGGINNITQGVGNGTYTHAVSTAVITGANSGYQAAQDMIGYIQTLRAAGKRVWIEEEEGADQTWTGSTWTANMSIQCGILNDIVEKFCRTQPGVTFIKWPTIFDKTSAVNKFHVGVKYDGIHDAVGGALLKAQYFLKSYPTAFPPYTFHVNPATCGYSGNTAYPVNLLLNPGFTTKTGGTAGTQVMTYSAWLPDTAYALKAFVTNNDYLYYNTVAGTSASSGGPSVTSGTTVDNQCTWQVICSWGAWAAGQTVPAKAFRINNGKIYYSASGGVCGNTAPDHAVGTQADGFGGVSWLFVCSSTNSVPQSYGVTGGTNGYYHGSVNTGSDNVNEYAMIAFFTQAGSNLGLLGGSDYDAGFRAKQVIGSAYSCIGTIQVDDHVGIACTAVRWSRGDMSNVPASGYTASTFYIDNMSRYAAGLGSYPLTERKMTPSMVCDVQYSTVTTTAAPQIGNTAATLSSAWTGSTGTFTLTFSDSTAKTVTLTNGSTAVSWTGALTAAATTSVQVTTNGNVPGTVATWNDLDAHVYGATAGFAIVRFKDLRVMKA